MIMTETGTKFRIYIASNVTFLIVVNTSPLVRATSLTYREVEHFRFVTIAEILVMHGNLSLPEMSGNGSVSCIILSNRPFIITQLLLDATGRSIQVVYTRQAMNVMAMRYQPLQFLAVHQS